MLKNFTNKCHKILDTLENYTEDNIISHYPNFKKVKEEADNKIKELAQMFSIDYESFVQAGVKGTDSVNTILSKVYEQEAKSQADNDAQIKSLVDSIKELNPNDKNFGSQLNKKVDELNFLLPRTVKEQLTKYLSRRTLVLSWMEKALKEELLIQKEASKKSTHKGKKHQPEALLHNILFPKHSSNVIESNLWMLNDEYIHFEGISESKLDDVIIGGKRLMKQDLSEEERKYKERQAIGNKKIDVGTRRPDILLFPAEGRCIIIEFKAPGVDVSDYLPQIQRYASIIHNLSSDEFKFNSFYGYLIGESEDIYSIIDTDGNFKRAATLGYLVRPHFEIPDLFGKGSPSLYTEIINYSDLLKRAKLRNKVFTDPIIGSENYPTPDEE